MGKEGSIIAIPMLPKEIAPRKSIGNDVFVRENQSFLRLPATISIYGSLISVLNEGPSIGSLATPGFKTANCNTIYSRNQCKSNRKKQAYARQLILMWLEPRMEMLCQCIHT